MTAETRRALPPTRLEAMERTLETEPAQGERNR